MESPEPCFWLCWRRALLLTSRLDSALGTDAGHLLHQWENLAYTAAFVSAAVLLFTHPGLPLPSRLLSSAGKCTLTCYVSQTLVFTFLFFGWGLGWRKAWGRGRASVRR